MVEKTKEKKAKEERIDFCLNASDITDISLNEEESERLIKLLDRGPNEKAKKFTKEAIEFYQDMVNKMEQEKFPNNVGFQQAKSNFYRTQKGH